MYTRYFSGQPSFSNQHQHGNLNTSIFGIGKRILVPERNILMTPIYTYVLMTAFTMRNLKKYSMVKLGIRKNIPNIISIVESLYFYNSIFPCLSIIPFFSQVPWIKIPELSLTSLPYSSHLLYFLSWPVITKS